MSDPKKWQRRHRLALYLYLALVAGHFSEHLLQLVQVYWLGWSPRLAGGLLGLYFPSLAASEVLHMTYNSLQLTGLIILLPGFKGLARRLWLIALVFQSWHFIEHAFLQIQYLTGHYFLGAIKQMSFLEIFFPRLELHFVYNLLVFVPTILASLIYLKNFAAFSPDLIPSPRSAAS
ncbi:MAG: hypothetical protein R2865_05465, partial [Deinococcales bacterium]